MFKYITTTIINENKDLTTGQKLWTYEAEDAGQHKVGKFNIKRHLTFLKPYVRAIYKAEAYEPTLAKATVDLTAITQASGVFRIAMYIRLSGSQNSLFANDMVFKGKPLYIEFEKKQGEENTALAKRIAAIADKYITQAYEYKIIKVSASDSKVVIDAVDEYELFTKCELQYYNPEGGFQFCCNTEGDYETIASPDDGTSKITITQGKQGFGTYSWLLHNFRLPTAANTRWNRIVIDETPRVGKLYNEYIVEYCMDRGIMGGDAVGEPTKSITQHVFYVNQDVSADFENGLKVLGDITGPTGSDSASLANDALAKVSALEKKVETLTTQLAGKADASALANKADASALASKQDALTAGNGIDLAGNSVSVKLNGSTLTADASGLKVADQTLEGKQDKLTAGNGVDISGGTVKVKLDGDTLTAGANGLKVTDGKFEPKAEI